jgi:Asp-tRNA(Asn)/Glu-tRNA(Gln) amidotransferase A subunit family amidase
MNAPIMTQSFWRNTPLRMMNMTSRHTKLFCTLAIATVLQNSAVASNFDVTETTISKVHKALLDGSVTCETLTRTYIKRIQLYDQATGLNSIIVINPEAMLRASDLDRELADSGNLKPLHCVPMIVKDNYNTRGLQTTAGSSAMYGFIPEKDAWLVARVKEAGALVLAKSNMAEWAFSPRVTISSVSGETRNPYNLDHVPAGSSGGTGAAVAANFGLAGFGTDTGNSIRGPSSHNALVGIRPTIGLTSRSGIFPLFLRNDVGGPMARTVEDATRILQEIVGPDSEDPITKFSKGQYPEDFVGRLDAKALDGVRVGVMRHLADRDSDPEVMKLFEAALKKMEELGATIVDPIHVDNFDEISANHWCRMFKHDLNEFLAENANRSPMKDLQEIVDTGLYSDYIAEDLKGNASVVNPEKLNPPCKDIYNDERRVAFRSGVVDAMDKANVSAAVYPSWNFLPGRIGHPDDYRGDNNQVIAPHTGLPAITVPMGYVNGLPTGLQFLGRLFSEADILPLVYAYEQATLHRKVPAGFE